VGASDPTSLFRVTGILGCELAFAENDIFAGRIPAIIEE
jgi:hypothetical protein